MHRPAEPGRKHFRPEKRRCAFEGGDVIGQRHPVEHAAAEHRQPKGIAFAEGNGIVYRLHRRVITAP